MKFEKQTQYSYRWIQFALIVEQWRIFHFGKWLVWIRVAGRALDSGPGANAAATPHNRMEDERVILDLRLLQHNGLAYANTRTDRNARTYGHIGTKLKER